jgi:hypothetical protein
MAVLLFVKPPPLLVATTPRIVITGQGGGAYVRMGTGTTPMEEWTLTGYAYRSPNQYFPSGDGTILYAPNSTISDGYSNQLGTPYNSWTLVYMYYDGQYANWITQVISSNQSTDASTIPTTGWSQTLTIAPDTFPASISLEGLPTLYPITSLSEIQNYNYEIQGLAEQNTPYRIYLSTTPNGVGGINYIYMIYLANATSGYYSQNVTAGRWFIGSGYTFSNEDNEGYYTNYGYATALQSKSTPPSANIANWTRVVGYQDNGGTITNITFNY